MPIKNTSYTYGSVARFLHWSMVVLILAMLCVGFIMTDMENGPTKFQIYGLHKATGICILMLAIFRLIWKWKNISPLLPNTLDIWQKYAARGSHIILYVLMFAMPLSGWGMSSAAGFPVSVFGWFTLPQILPADKELLQFCRLLHQVIAYLIIILVLLHATAALLHHFYYKDNVLRRMLPFAKEKIDDQTVIRSHR